VRERREIEMERGCDRGERMRRRRNKECSDRQREVVEILTRKGAGMAGDKENGRGLHDRTGRIFTFHCKGHSNK
jgi:hypothetical protein